MILEGSVIKYHDATGDVVFGEVTQVVEKGWEYKVGNAGNGERVLDIDVIATYHQEQRVW